MFLKSQSFLLKLIAGALLLVYSFSGYAQNFRFTHITEENDLSQGVVNCILQDSRGFMWFGTQDGLNKYDGYNIKTFKHNPADSNSISNNFINTIYEDNNSTLWIGTAGGGVNEYNLSTGKFKSHLHIPGDSNSLSNDQVYAIFQNDEGKLLIGNDTALDMYDPQTGKFSVFLNNKKNSNFTFNSRPSCIMYSRDGRLWFGTPGGGIYSYTKKTKKFINYRQPEIAGDESSENINIIRTMYEDERGNLILGTYGKGLQFFDTHTNTFIQQFKHDNKNKQSLSNNRITSINKDENNILWIATYGNGIDLYNNKTGLFQHITYDEKNVDGLNNNTIRCIYHDRAGTKWIGTEGGGVNVYFPNTSRFKNIKKRDNSTNSLQSNTVFTIMQDRDSVLWIGTDKGGLSSLDLQTDSYQQYPKLSPGSNNSILSLCEDSDGIIWVGTYGNGLNSYNKKTKEITSYPQFQDINSGTIINIFEDSQHKIWVSTYGAGVFVYNKLTKQFKKYNKDNGLNVDKIYLTFEDSKHNIWIATDGGGVNRLDAIKKTFSYYTHNEKDRNSISSNTVLSMNEDSKGNMWFGTQCGLNKLNLKTGKFDFYFERDGLPNDVIYSVLFDKSGNIWMSTNKGISKFNPDADNQNGDAFTNFDANDGLQGLEFNQGAYFQNKKGELFLGGVNGLNVFNPNITQKNKNIPPVHIIGFKRSGKEVQLDTLIYDKKYIELSWRENFFSFDFAALNYQMPGKNKYKYKLEGVDADWSQPSTQRYTSYTQLSGGTYVFRVVAANNNGEWDSKGATLIIHITPPFWKTNWFYALCILLIIAGLWGFFSYRTRAIKKENKILEEKVAERTIELAQKNRDITSSIQYAKRIQLAVLPPLELIFKHFPNSFILYKPKDIVSGDFYWFGAKNGKNIIAVVDCTGHGVPGAFMSMIGHNLLNQIVSEDGITSPAEILIALHQGIQAALRQGTNVVDTSDGMDVAICSIDIETNELQFAGALRPLIIINNTKFEKLEADKFPIGGSQFGAEPHFTNKSANLTKGDTIYLASDGYADQFGGEKGKKFMVKRFYELLISIQNKTMKEQNEILVNAFNSWRGDIAQVDDILVVGIRF